MAMFSIRIGGLRPFIGTRDYDNEAAATLQAGLTTYSGDDADQSYQTSYLEWGGRSDHISDAIDKCQGNDAPVRRVVDASTTEQMYVADRDRNGIKPAVQAVPDAA